MLKLYLCHHAAQAQDGWGSQRAQERRAGRRPGAAAVALWRTRSQALPHTRAGAAAAALRAQAGGALPCCPGGAHPLECSLLRQRHAGCEAGVEGGKGLVGAPAVIDVPAGGGCRRRGSAHGRRLAAGQGWRSTCRGTPVSSCCLGAGDGGRSRPAGWPGSRRWPRPAPRARARRARRRPATRRPAPAGRAHHSRLFSSSLPQRSLCFKLVQKRDHLRASAWIGHALNSTSAEPTVSSSRRAAQGRPGQQDGRARARRRSRPRAGRPKGRQGSSTGTPRLPTELPHARQGPPCALQTRLPMARSSRCSQGGPGSSAIFCTNFSKGPWPTKSPQGIRMWGLRARGGQGRGPRLAARAARPRRWQPLRRRGGAHAAGRSEAGWGGSARGLTCGRAWRKP